MVCAEYACSKEQAKNSIKKKRLMMITYINRFVLYFAFVKQIDVHLPCTERQIKKNTTKDHFCSGCFYYISLPAKETWTRCHVYACVRVCVWGGGAQWTLTLTKLTHLYKSCVFRFILMNICRPLYSFRTYQPGFPNNVDYRS